VCVSRGGGGGAEAGGGKGGNSGICTKGMMTRWARARAGGVGAGGNLVSRFVSPSHSLSSHSSAPVVHPWTPISPPSGILQVTELKVRYLDSVPPCVSLCILRSGFLFCASEAGNHGFYQVHLSPKIATIPKLGIGGRHPRFFRVHHRPPHQQHPARLSSTTNGKRLANHNTLTCRTPSFGVSRSSSPTPHPPLVAPLTPASSPPLSALSQFQGVGEDDDSPACSSADFEVRSTRPGLARRTPSSPLPCIARRNPYAPLRAHLCSGTDRRSRFQCAPSLVFSPSAPPFPLHKPLTDLLSPAPCQAGDEVVVELEPRPLRNLLHCPPSPIMPAPPASIPRPSLTLPPSP
jgi:hypothetical protein